jgi:6-phosphogluconate dehydrogenase
MRQEITMNELGIIGLGKMGANMARRLARAGVPLTLHDQNKETSAQLAREIKGTNAATLADLVTSLKAPRHLWLMLPSGKITEETIQELKGKLSADDLVIDGANSFYKDSQRRAQDLSTKGIAFIDAGVSGGIWGEKNGYALMVGGTPSAVGRIEPILKALAPAPDTGWLHCGPSGSGHFVKMIHNGIEYGMMQAYAEGLSLLEHKKEFDLDLGKVTEMWRHGSVVRSWLLDLIASFLGGDGGPENVAPFVADSGEGRWTVLESIEQGVPAPVISLALMSRFNSQGKDDFAATLLALMRKSFGGHDVKKS